MDSSKKHVSSDQILPSRRKVLSRFGLGIGASLIILTWLFLSNSLSGPKVLPFFQGLDSVSGGSSPGSWHFSFSTSSSGNATGAEQGQRMKEANASRVAQKEDFKRADGKAMALETTHLGNSSEEVKKANFNAGQERIQQKTREANGSVVAENGSSLRNSSIGSLLSEGKTIGKPMENSTYRISTVTGDHNVGNFSRNEEVSRLPVGEDRPGNANSTVNNSIEIPSSDSQLMKNPDDSYENCDIFDGKWVRDDSKPYYPAGSCPYIDRDFDCHLNGRPDDGYVKWKWQPNGCNIPSLNATDFLEKIRGKKLVFVGDSLNRNMWESLVCILRNSIRNKKRVYEISGRREFKKKGFYAFRFEDYNCSVDFVSAPFLVRESSFKDENGTLETLRLDLMDRTTSMYHDADIIIFNTGHWWTHEKTSKGENYYQEGNHVYPRLKVLEAYRKALSTWARWVDKNIDSGRTQVFFRGYSVTHFRGGPWNSGGQCHKETEPIFNENHLVKYPSKMRALDHVLLGMNTPVVYLNISRLTDYRKDGHPSIYRSQFKTLEEKVAAERYQDCSHWCLPGVPDTWNELLYVSLLKAGRGSQKN